GRERPRRRSALGPDTLNVIGSDPPVWISTSPEVKYQSNTSATPSLRSATEPSSDMDMIATTFDIACSFRGMETARRIAWLLRKSFTVGDLSGAWEISGPSAPAWIVAGDEAFVAQILGHSMGTTGSRIQPGSSGAARRESATRPSASNVTITACGCVGSRSSLW